MSLFASLRNTANTFSVLDRSVEVVQNNIANASTPGFSRQMLPVYSRPFEPGVLPGGISAGSLRSARDTFSELNVRRQAEMWGSLDQKKATLAELETIFDVSGKTGIGAGMTRLFQSFSAWSVSPGSESARRDVLTAADSMASEFRKTARLAADSSQMAAKRAQDVTTQINDLVGILRTNNISQRQLSSPDPAREAQFNDTLEKLSELVHVTALPQDDGTHTILLDGQVPLLIGDRQQLIKIDFDHDLSPAPLYPEAPPPMIVVDENGADVSFAVGNGRLGALLELRNETMGELIGSSDQPGKINDLALQIAERINSISVAAGGPPLLTYDAARPAATAATLQLNAAVDPSDLVANDGVNANGVALRLAALSRGEDPLDRIGDMTYSEYFSDTMATVGRASLKASEEADVQGSLLNQARNLRAQTSGVSLDEEALHLMELQRAYEAIARMSAVLIEMTQVVMGIVR